MSTQLSGAALLQSIKYGELKVIGTTQHTIISPNRFITWAISNSDRFIIFADTTYLTDCEPEQSDIVRYADKPWWFRSWNANITVIIPKSVN